MRTTAALACAAAIFAGCGASGEQNGDPENGVDPVYVSPESIEIVDSMTVATGPTIAGSLQPEIVSSIRAEVGGSILETFAEEGESVRAGQQLARIDDAALQDAALSARSAVTTAEQSAELARRNLERAERLAQAGAIAERELENARIALTTAESQLSDAKARLAQAEKQLRSTRIASPIAGVVSERAVNAGDVVTPGMLLFTVVNPRSMKLVASVPAAAVGALEVGAPVEFQVTGYPGRTFNGRLRRINPTVDPATGQVEIQASLPNTGGRLVGGVFAEGRVGTTRTTALALPITAVQRTGEAASVLVIREGTVARVPVQLGIRDEQAERYAIVSGIAAGDTVLVGAAMGIPPGTPVLVQSLADRPAGHSQ